MEEQVYLENELASRFDRFIARVIDRFCALAIGIVLFLTLGFIPVFQLFFIGIAILTPLAYLFFKDAFPFLNGQSLGKRALGIRVIYYQSGLSTTGQYKTSFVRELLQWIPFLNLVDALLIFSGESYQRLADRMVDTQVIKL